MLRAVVKGVIRKTLQEKHVTFPISSGQNVKTQPPLKVEVDAVDTYNNLVFPIIIPIYFFNDKT